MIRPTITTQASHLPARIPSIRFLGKNRIPTPHHAPTAHAAAPQSVIDAFPSFLKKLSASTKANAAPKSVQPTTPPSSSSSTVASTLPKAQYEGEWEMPMHLRRNKYAPTLDEIEAVESGGATAAPLVTKASRSAWYTPAKLS